jgi:hypothetical protein
MPTTPNQGNIWWVLFRQVTVDVLKYNGGMLRLAERLPREIYTREEQQVLDKELTSSLRTPSTSRHEIQSLLNLDGGTDGAPADVGPDNLAAA